MILSQRRLSATNANLYFSTDAFAGLADHTLVCKRMPCLSYSHMTYEGSNLSSPNFQTNGTLFWGRWELLVRRRCSVVKLHGKISSIVILPLKFSVFSINGMGIITFIHAGATIPLLFGNKLMAHSTHSHCYRHPASLKKHSWLKWTQGAEKQMGLGWMLVSVAFVLGTV